jgi:GDPmannose 4,6-dehydratase
MFGKVRETPQNELTPFHPRSPYGVAKTFAHYSCVNYREAYEMHISCGILFNHEGERRGHEFVTRKISSTVAKIKLGKADELRLGTLTPRRDWGYAGDYVEAMHLMTQQEVADDFVIATGETHSVEEFVDLAFEIANIPNGKERYVKIDKEFQRPAEVDLLVGDPTKASQVLDSKSEIIFTDYSKAYKVGYEDMHRRVPDISKINKIIGWKPKIGFKELVQKMVEHDLRLES